jgi:hypothetical protein
MSYVLGVSLSVAGSTILNLGHNLMKRDHMRNALLPAAARRVYMCRWRWAAGFAVFLAGNVLDFLALGLVAQSVAAPLGAVAIVTNVGFATRFLGEAFSRRDALGTALVVLGAVLCVVFGSHEDRPVALRDLGPMIRSNTALWIYWAACAAVVALLAAAVPVVACAVRGGDSGRAGRGGAGAGAFARRHARLQPMLHTSIGGVVGAQTIIGAKILSELLEGLARTGKSPFGDGYFYLVIALTGLSGVTQIHQFQVALRQADALVVVPAFFVVWTLLSVTGGGIFFREFDNFSAARAFGFVAGVAVTTAGVVILASRLRVDDVVNDIAPHISRIANTDELDFGSASSLPSSSSSSSSSSSPSGNHGGASAAADTTGTVRLVERNSILDVDDVDIVTVGAGKDGAAHSKPQSSSSSLLLQSQSQSRRAPPLQSSPSQSSSSSLTEGLLGEN